MKFTRRLALCAPICFAASFITAGSASAAIISAGNEALSLTSTTQLLNTGTKVFAWDVGGNTTPATVNGILFNNAQPASVTLSASPTTWQATSTDSSTGNPYSDPGMKAVLNDFLYTVANTNATLTVSGLTVGQEYRIQFLHSQDGVSDSARQMQVLFGSSAATGTTGLFAAGTTAHISTLNFIADNTTQLFTFTNAGGSNADDRSLLNGATLFAVPEPSAALLGGLGLLTLLRRRRA